MTTKKRRSRRTEHAAARRLSEEAYNALLRAQGSRCALCPRLEPRILNPEGRIKRFNVDHDHKTMKVRGLLCWQCNKHLHYWLTPAWLRRAADYLEVHT